MSIIIPYTVPVCKAILEQAIADATFKTPPGDNHHPSIEEKIEAKQDAIRWFTEPNYGYDTVCYLYGLTPDLFRTYLKRFHPQIFKENNNCTN